MTRAQAMQRAYRLGFNAACYILDDITSSDFTEYGKSKQERFDGASSYVETSCCERKDEGESDYVIPTGAERFLTESSAERSYQRDSEIYSRWTEGISDGTFATLTKNDKEAKA